MTQPTSDPVPASREPQDTINRAQGGINRRQGQVNKTQGEINDEQGDFNDDVVDGTAGDDSSILAAIDMFEAEAIKLRMLVIDEHSARIRRDSFVSKLFVAVTVAFVGLLVLGGLVWNQQRIYNHERCITSQNTRAALKDNLTGLAAFGLGLTSTPEAKAKQIVATYRAKVDRDIPDVRC